MKVGSTVLGPCLPCLLWFLVTSASLEVLESPESIVERSQRFLLSHTDHFQSTPVEVNVNLQQSVNTIGSHFVGVTIDTGIAAKHWLTLDFNSRKVQNLARGLVPGYLRFGGTTADRVLFMPPGSSHHHHQGRAAPPPNITHFHLQASQWVALNEFIQKVGWDFIMDLNAMTRNADWSWNPDNARLLLQFSQDRNYTIAGFQLGNEYNHYRGTFHTTLPPAQLAKDVLTLQKLLSEFPLYAGAFLLDPEVGGHNMDEAFSGFLQAGGYKAIRAATFHFYYFDGSQGNMSWFTDVGMMDTFSAKAESVMNQTRAVDPLLPVWLTETSSASHGGAGVSDKFVAGFLWLDKLGVGALKGLKTILRQQFYGGTYCLIDADLNPNPDYWLTLLYKRIVRGAVFSATGRHDVRVYSACANPDNFNPGSLVVYILNPNSYSVTFDLPQFSAQPRLRYILTAGDGDGLRSKFMALNGVKLELLNDDLPPLNPESAPPGPKETVPPYSYTFLVFPDANVSICLH